MNYGDENYEGGRAATCPDWVWDKNEQADPTICPLDNPELNPDKDIVIEGADLDSSTKEKEFEQDLPDFTGPKDEKIIPENLREEPGGPPSGFIFIYGPYVLMAGLLVTGVVIYLKKKKH
jgi:hypothetical protein